MNASLPAVLLILSPAVAPPVSAADVRAGSEHVSVRLVSEVAAISPGQPFTVAIHLSMAPGWHTYWKNPGDSGMPTRVTWTLPDGFKAGDLEWPAPMRAVDAGLALYGYEGEATFLSEITPSPALSAGRFSIKADVRWLECKDICIPGKAQLTVDLPSLPGRQPSALDPGQSAFFASARQAIPVQLASMRAAHAVKDGRLVLTLSGAPALAEPLEFFPEVPSLIEAAQAQAAARAGRGWTISMNLAANAPAPPPVLTGVLLAGPGSKRRAYLVSARADLPGPAQK